MRDRSRGHGHVRARRRGFPRSRARVLLPGTVEPGTLSALDAGASGGGSPAKVAGAPLERHLYGGGGRTRRRPRANPSPQLLQPALPGPGERPAGHDRADAHHGRLQRHAGGVERRRGHSSGKSDHHRSLYRHPQRVLQPRVP